MNEVRIRELAQQAGLKMIHDETLALGYLNTPTKKFAKLIIRECTNVLDELSELPDDIGGNAYLKAGSMKIKEHFGVE